MYIFFKTQKLKKVHFENLMTKHTTYSPKQGRGEAKDVIQKP